MSEQPGVWCRADEWHGEVTLDGRAVERCRGVLFDGERPVALEVYATDDAGYCLFRGDQAVITILRGEITASLRRRGTDCDCVLCRRATGRA